MKHILHKANTRGHANHGWLDSYEKLNRRDGLGITGEGKLEIKADSEAELLLMEVPM